MGTCHNKKFHKFHHDNVLKNISVTKDCIFFKAGKAKQSAKTEIEKLEMKNMTCKDLIKEAAKIIYLVHDEVKDKMFELELSWVTKDTEGKHVRVPKDIHDAAETFAKEALEEDSDSDADDMS